MSNAYNKVKWCFLEKVMLKLGFDTKWVGLVLSCLTLVSYKVLPNAIPTSSFGASRGLRQGDLLFLYLFVLYAKALSLLIKDAERRRMLKGVKICNGALINRPLCFADDGLLFSQATKSKNDYL